MMTIVRLSRREGPKEAREECIARCIARLRTLALAVHSCDALHGVGCGYVRGPFFHRFAMVFPLFSRPVGVDQHAVCKWTQGCAAVFNNLPLRGVIVMAFCFAAFTNLRSSTVNVFKSQLASSRWC